MTKRTIIGSRQCTGAECENIIPVYESGCNGSHQPKFCRPCVRAKRRATNKRVAAEHRRSQATLADTRAPLFKVTGGHFQAMDAAKIVDNWSAWQRGELEMV